MEERYEEDSVTDKVYDFPFEGAGLGWSLAEVGEVIWTSLSAEVDLWWGDFCSPPGEFLGFVGVSNIMLARKLSSMLAPPGVPLLLRETGTEPGGGVEYKGVETENRERGCGRAKVKGVW